MQIRMASTADAAAVREIYAPYCSTPITFEFEPPSIAEIERRMTETLKRYPWLVMIDDSKVIGYAYGHEFRDRPAYQWSVETSLYVTQGYHKRGVGSRLYDELLTMLKAQGFVVAMAGITLPNAGSVRLHEKFAFKPVGTCVNIGFKNGAWHEVGFFQLELNPPSKNPATPLAVHQLATGALSPG
jgi:L-amino acid N-acyltransferase YncA